MPYLVFLHHLLLQSPCRGMIVLAASFVTRQARGLETTEFFWKFSLSEKLTQERHAE